MSSTVASIDKFHNTPKGKLIFGAVEWIVSYMIISRAIDTGSLWEWTLGILLFIGGLTNLVRTLFYRAKKDAKHKKGR
jgi:hypothetical protein